MMMERIRNFFKNTNVQKYTALGLLLLILAAIPLTLSQVKTQQTTQNHAAWQVTQEQHYACGGNLTVLMDLDNATKGFSNGESPDCTGGSGYISDGSLKAFRSSLILRAQSGSAGAYTVHWKWDSFWCPNEDPHAPCLTPIGSTGEQTGGLTGDNAIYVTATSKTFPNNPQACGYFQNDFGFFVVDNNSGATLCGISLSNLGNTNNNASWCHTGTSCSNSTPTPTPTPTTPVTPPTNTPTITPGVTVTDTPTATVTPTPTGPTSTPNPSNTPTPTGNPTATPTAPVTVIVTPTPKPTLPPTGPGSTLVNIGFAGIAIALLGIAGAIGF